MSDAKVVQLLQSVGKHRVLQLEDGSIVERVDGTASWRNNNPGNLKFEFAGSADSTARATRSREQALAFAHAKYLGIVGLDQWGNAVFETLQAGRAAQIQLLRSRFGAQTVEQMVQGYSTADYSGATHHAEQVRAIYRTADAAGSDLRGKTIAAMNPRELAALADGIGHFEGFRAGAVRVLAGPALQAQRLATAAPSLNIAEQEAVTPVRVERRVSNVAPAGSRGTLHGRDPDHPASMQPGHHPRSAQAPHLHAALHPGAHGARVRALQAALNRLGIADAQGQRLSEDGHYGHRTRDAVAAFQAAHGLPAAGVAGPRTQAALLHADAQLVNSPAHPDHRLFARVLHQWRVAEAAHGLPPGPHDERIAGALLVQMRRDGIEHVDRIEINHDGSMARAVWVSPLRDESGLNRASRAIDLHHAAQHPLRASSDDLLQAGLAHAVQEHQLARQHSPPRPQVAHVHA